MKLLGRKINCSLAILLILGTFMSIVKPSNAGVTSISNVSYVPNHIPVTICHATGSNSNPFIKITVDDDAVDGNGNGNADHNQDGHQNGEDIIPPGNWDIDGRNWNTQGQIIWANNCNASTVASPTPTPTKTYDKPTPTPTPITCPVGHNLNGNGICIVIDCPGQGTCEVVVGSTPTPTPTNEPTPTPGSGTSIVQSATGSSDDKKSESKNEPVKTMAPTGNFTSIVSNASILLGLALTSTALPHYAKRKKK